MTARLCYVVEHWAFFTTAPLSQQWGDDWDDAPYEHNSGEPYDYADYMAERGMRPYTITRVAWRGKLDTPADRAGNSSFFSVKDINRGDAPWLVLNRYVSRTLPPSECALFAGATLAEFCEFVHLHGGEVYLRHNPESGRADE